MCFHLTFAFCRECYRLCIFPNEPGLAVFQVFYRIAWQTDLTVKLLFAVIWHCSQFSFMSVFTSVLLGEEVRTSDRSENLYRPLLWYFYVAFRWSLTSLVLIHFNCMEESIKDILQNNVFLCSSSEKKAYRFKIKWGWANDTEFSFMGDLHIYI